MSGVCGFCVRCNELIKKMPWCSGSREDCAKILLDTIEALQTENEQLKDENISIRKWNKFVDEDYPKLFAENKRLQYTLIGVMHSVDKWFDEVDESVDEVNRAAQAREIALQAIEKRDAALKKAREQLYKFYENRHEGDKLYIYAGLPELKEALAAIDKIGGREDV